MFSGIAKERRARQVANEHRKLLREAVLGLVEDPETGEMEIDDDSRDDFSDITDDQEKSIEKKFDDLIVNTDVDSMTDEELDQFIAEL